MKGLMWVLVGLWAMSGVRVLLEVRGLTGFEGSTLGGGGEFCRTQLEGLTSGTWN